MERIRRISTLGKQPGMHNLGIFNLYRCVLQGNYAFRAYEKSKATTDACGGLEWLGEYSSLAAWVSMIYLCWDT